jgi:4-amino-4-deoxy-L-arabinose transferase-like glycosyltransferase
MVVGFVHALAWTVAIAPLTGPDEDNHAAAIQHIAETGRGVQATGGTGTYSREMDQLLTAGGLRQMAGNKQARPEFDTWDEVTEAADNVGAAGRKNGSGPNPIANNPPLYYWAGAAIYKLSPDTSLTARLFLLRLCSTLAMPLLVLLGWLIACELFVSVWPRALTATLIALQPKLAFMCAIVNPDALLIVLTTLTVLLALRVVKRGPSPLSMGLLGLSAGAAMMTHGRGITAVLIALLAGAIALAQNGQWRARVLSTGALICALAVPVLIALAYTRAHNSVGAFGGQVTQATAAGFGLRGYLESIWQFYLPRPGFMAQTPGADIGFRQIYINSFFSQQGGLEIGFTHRTNSVLELAAQLGMLLLVWAAVARRRVLMTRWKEVTIIVGTVVAMVLTLHFSEYRARLGGASALITGRYLLVAIAAYATAAAFAINALPRKIGAVLGGLLIASNIVLAIGALGLAVERLNA